MKLQASVEAAFLVPVLMVLCALLVQPVILMYTKQVMEGACGDGVRLYAGGASEADTRAFMERRLKAVPDLDVFHVGGREGWAIACRRDENQVFIKVTGHVRLIPVVGIPAGLFYVTDSQGVRLEAERRADMYPPWVEGNYEQWLQVWD